MTGLRAIWAFTVATLTQQSRDRFALFFMIVLPIAIMVIIGSTYGGATNVEVLIVDEGDPERSSALVTELDAAEGIEAALVGDIEAARTQIRRLDAEAAVIVRRVPGSVDGEGEWYELIVSEVSAEGQVIRPIIERAINRIENPSGTPSIELATRTVGEARFAGTSDFSLTAAQNLVLFTFINAVTAATLLVSARRQGVLRRAFASRASPLSISLGIVGGWFCLAMVQSLIIIGVGGLAFGVDWGDPLAAAVLTTSFALVGTGCGLLVGSSFRSEDQVGSFVPTASLVLAALGGCMVPNEIFPPLMITVAKVTPHYWALEAWKKLIFDGDGLGGIGVEVAILAVIAAVLIGLATVRLTRLHRGGGWATLSP